MILGITCGGPATHILEALAAGLPEVLIREPLFPEGLVLPEGPGIRLHARMPDARARAGGHGWGLHLPGGADLERERTQFQGFLSYSAHSRAEAEAALAIGIDECLLSPIWKPTSKPEDSRPPLGLSVFTGSQRLRALGGVTPERVRACLQAGACGVAVMGGIFGEREVEVAVRRFLSAI